VTSIRRMVEALSPGMHTLRSSSQFRDAEKRLAEQEERPVPGGDASAELIRRSVHMILAQTGAGAGTAVLMGATLGVVFVPVVGWGPYLAWYLLLAFFMLARQPYFYRLVERDGPTEATLRHIAIVVALTGWFATLSVPLFSAYVSVADLGVLTIITVGWVSVAVSLLAVQPRVYALYLAACLGTVFVGWLRHTGSREVLLVGIAMLLGGPMLVRLAHIVQAQLRDAVEAAQQNSVLVRQLRAALQVQQETQRARSRFLGAASHDLRQPVQALLFLSDIFRKSTDPARRDAMAQQIIRTGESIDGMFRHLVDFAQIDAGTMRAVVQPMHLEHIVGAAVAGFSEKCAARGLRFRVEMPEHYRVSADPVLLERMLRNFLDNAFKYSLRGEIVLRVQRDDDEVVLSVSDQGVGMEPEELAQACNAFFRGRSASLAEAEGIGLGLATSRHMADLMEAPLHIVSEPGRGTRVIVRLPLAHEASRPAPLHPTHWGDSLLMGRLVAVVENDRLAREALCSWLQEAGARVAEASSLPQLREVLRDLNEAPELLLADYRLADGTGVDVVEAVRATYGWVPAWIITGEPDIAQLGLDLPVLQKPITPDRLLEALAAAFPNETTAALRS
jgi:two-component system, sensor histidine kinase